MKAQIVQPKVRCEPNMRLVRCDDCMYSLLHGKVASQAEVLRFSPGISGKWERTLQPVNKYYWWTNCVSQYKVIYWLVQISHVYMLWNA